MEEEFYLLKQLQSNFNISLENDSPQKLLQVSSQTEV